MSTVLIFFFTSLSKTIVFSDNISSIISFKFYITTLNYSVFLIKYKALGGCYEVTKYKNIR